MLLAITIPGMETCLTIFLSFRYAYLECIYPRRGQFHDIPDQVSYRKVPHVLVVIACIDLTVPPVQLRSSHHRPCEFPVSHGWHTGYSFIVSQFKLHLGIEVLDFNGVLRSEWLCNVPLTCCQCVPRRHGKHFPCE